MKFLRIIYLSISIVILRENISNAQSIDFNGFNIGKSWDFCEKLIRKNYPNSFWIDPSKTFMSFDNGMLSCLDETSVYFKNNKVYKLSSRRTIDLKYGNPSNLFERCFSILESRYGIPIQISESPEITWNINDTIIRLNAQVGNNYCTIDVVFEKGVILIKNEAASLGSDSYTSSGSGIILTTNGIIVTNHHVIENASAIDVQLTRNGEVKTYKAKVLIDDKTNDLALVKIEDATFHHFPSIPYALKTSICDVGTSVFAMGYPMSNYLGEEVKITDGLISSKTGFQGDIVTYQISAPIQHGSSGGPLFDKQGNLVGITNAGIPEADNVGYAIKASYLKNLIDVSPIPVNVSTSNNISHLSFTEKIKILSKFVVYIKIK